jgi:hypothetical protein
MICVDPGIDNGYPYTSTCFPGVSSIGMNRARSILKRPVRISSEGSETLEKLVLLDRFDARVSRQLRQHIIKRTIFAYLKNDTLDAERSQRKSADLVETILTRELFGEGCPHLRRRRSQSDNHLPSLELPGKRLGIFICSPL